MSFGYAIGDFIATGELCWKLYRQVYTVSRDAPAEVQSLRQDLESLTNTIKLLKEDIDQPDSALAQSGPDRVELTNRVMRETRIHLSSLETLAGKYDILRPNLQGKRSFVKRNWMKIQYAKEVRHINDIRAKIKHQLDILNLVLLAGNNSSLQRIQTQNHQLLVSIETIKISIATCLSGSQAPTQNGLSDLDRQLQFDIARMMMEKAESNGSTWSSIGIENWLQAGKWWLMKAQAYLYSTAPESEGNCQAYADLLKASWVLTDIIATHPQASFLSSGRQQLEIQHFSEVIKAEHGKFQQSSLSKPKPERLLSADYSIWGKVAKTRLSPNLNSNLGDQPLFWRSGSGEILYQRFGYHRSRSTGLATECIVLLEVRAATRALNVIAQTFDGHDLLNENILSPHVNHNITEVTGDVEFSILIDDQQLIFQDFESFRVLFLLLRDIRSAIRTFPEAPLDSRTLQALALLQCTLEGQNKIVLNPLEETDLRLLRGQNEEKTTAHGEDLWAIAVASATMPKLSKLVYMATGGEALWIEEACLRNGEVPLRRWRLFHRITLVSFLCWASPTVSCYFAFLDALAPSMNKFQIEEAIYAGILREDGQIVSALLKKHWRGGQGRLGSCAEGEVQLSKILIENARIILELPTILETPTILEPPTILETPTFTGYDLGTLSVLIWAAVKLEDEHLVDAVMNVLYYTPEHAPFSFSCELFSQVLKGMSITWRNKLEQKIKDWTIRYGQRDKQFQEVKLATAYGVREPRTSSPG